MTRNEIENRLVKFTVDIIKLSKNLKFEYASEYLANQIVRSSSSSALNYGETQGATSYKDFIHKMSIVLKELRETYINLKIIHQSELWKNNDQIKKLLLECNELICIFHKSVRTAKSKKKQ